MDNKLATYHQLIKTILDHYEKLTNQHPKKDQETIAIYDEEKRHYLLHRMGWKDDYRLWNTIVYVRLRDGKIWIEEDGLEHGIATDLLEAGVPKEDIVLAFHHPDKRPYTEFAVA